VYHSPGISNPVKTLHLYLYRGHRPQQAQERGGEQAPNDRHVGAGDGDHVCRTCILKGLLDVLRDATLIAEQDPGKQGWNTIITKRLFSQQT
jgi:hypothetical protein